MARSETASRWFLVQASLLIIPFLFLAALAVYLLRQDKAAVEHEARERVEQVASALLNSISVSATNFITGDYLELTEPWPEGTSFFQQDSGGRLLFPPPLLPAHRGEWRLSESESNMWMAAEAAEFRSNDFAGALRIWKSLIESSRGSQNVAARFEKAIVLERAGEAEEAQREFAALTVNLSDARLASGIPVAALASWKVMAYEKVQGRERAEAAARSYASNLLARPSEYSGQFLSNEWSAGGTLQPIFATAMECWRNQEQARELHSMLQGSGGAGRKALEADGEPWRVFSRGTNVFMRSSNNFARLVRSKVDEMRGAIPVYAAMTLNLDDEPIYGGDSRLVSTPLWTRLTLPLASGSKLDCELFLADPAALYARQSVRARVFTSLLALAVLCAAFGVAWAQRSFRKQERLNELKSNFISSVSHELRAPLASMRLMSEGLQNGRVHDAEKQREYYGFLVQECRRLSALVENVLDFSRIDQNRRAYEFESSDLAEIGEAAIRTVSPIARERGVRLNYDSQLGGGSCAIVDALAIQQALVNLLDNGVKHSSVGEEVVLRATEDERGFEFSVTDRGPGVDPSEHQKIFDRFYRLGSELRRETQGVGIGLTIVKHVVEAHGGEVKVRSSPGKGASFIIRIPRRQGHE